jgi:hypothetical protein
MKNQMKNQVNKKWIKATNFYFHQWILNTSHIIHHLKLKKKKILLYSTETLQQLNNSGLFCAAAVI